jgi:hypothetical protein
MLSEQVDQGSKPSPNEIKDETGKTFGRLTVVERVFPKRNLLMRCRAVWLCRCSCGNELTVSGNLLRKGTFKECGTCAQAWRKK